MKILLLSIYMYMYICMYDVSSFESAVISNVPLYILFILHAKACFSWFNFC